MNRTPLREALETSANGITHLVALALAGLTLFLAGQPIYANDTWIHLALGEAFLAGGPWLAADPHLFAAPGPPSPSSWLGSVSIFTGYRLFGFTGLRVLHTLAVAFVLALAWRVMRHAGASRAAASLGVCGLVVLATYRLVQLRPDLFTIAATYGLYLLLLVDPEGPSRRRIALAALLGVVWANVHAAFLLGPILVLGCAAVVAAAALLRGGEPRADELRRAARLALAGLVLLAAGCANPQGPGAYRAYFASGAETMGLEAIIDEWNPTDLFAWPIAMLPPTLAAWGLCWITVFGIGAAGIVALRERWTARPLAAFSAGSEAGAGGAEAARAAAHSNRRDRVDPALLGLACAALVASLIASRFLWLLLFALALMASLLRRAPCEGAAPAAPGTSPLERFVPAALALASVVALIAHLQIGDWPLVSRAARAEGADYAVAYPTDRYSAHAVWFLADAGLEGRIFNDYPLGGFLAFWLAPKIQMSSSGTMNVAREAMQANFAIGARQTLSPDESYAALLDRQGIDLFLGAGYPIEATPGRPIPCTNRHLEHEPGWLLVFRNLQNAVYLRLDAANAANLERVAAYYERAGVPFDRTRGFVVDEVVARALPWAVAHGVVPADYEALVQHVETQRKTRTIDAQTHRLAMLYATLGLYARALEVEQLLWAVQPGDPSTAWRTIWSLAQLGRWDDALAAAGALERRERAAGAGAGTGWSATLEQLRSADPGARATLLAHLPVVRLEQLDWIRSGVAQAPARTSRAAR
ncbi:MAG: hypothetical protein R3F21_18015 [Myxococcota bacterium]